MNRCWQIDIMLRAAMSAAAAVEPADECDRLLARLCTVRDLLGSLCDFCSSPPPSLLSSLHTALHTVNNVCCHSAIMEDIRYTCKSDRSLIYTENKSIKAIPNAFI